MELETTLHEVEAGINSRPLTFVGDELDSGAPLTPSLCLLGRSFGHKSIIKDGKPEVTSQDLWCVKSSADAYLRGSGRVGPTNKFVVSHPARALLPTREAFVWDL